MDRDDSSTVRSPAWIRFIANIDGFFGLEYAATLLLLCGLPILDNPGQHGVMRYKVHVGSGELSAGLRVDDSSFGCRVKDLTGLAPPYDGMNSKLSAMASDKAIAPPQHPLLYRTSHGALRSSSISFTLVLFVV